VLRLRTESASQTIEDQQRNAREKLKDRILLVQGIVGLITTLVVAFAIERWIAVLGLMAAGLIALYSVVYFLKVRKLTLGQPASRRKSVLIVQADLDSVAARCQLALASLQALTVEDTNIDIMNNSRAILQGGTGGWPNGGQRVTIRLRRLSHGRCFVLVESASFLPTIRTPRQNSINVLRIIRHLVD
jgi:hypothetical protein